MTGSGSDELYAWQAEALDSWRSRGRHGIVEAVTGTGKTKVGLEAIRQALDEGRRAAVLVPTIALRQQWHGELRKALPGSVKIGKMGDGSADTLGSHHVVVAVVNAAANKPLTTNPGHLIVADECHRYAAPTFHKALLNEFELRLGLTATLERPDRQEHLLTKYFGDVCFSIAYGRALADEVVAHYSLALIGVPMTGAERSSYDELTTKMGEDIQLLENRYRIPTTPFHLFLRRVTELADDSSAAGCDVARRFLATTQSRKRLMANSAGKRAAVGDLVPALRAAERVLVFTETQQSADEIAAQITALGLPAKPLHAGLSDADPLDRLRDFKEGKFRVLVAVKALNEGVDVPAVDLGVIVSASRTRRDMIQRMGRVLRRKPDDRLARFAVIYLQDSTEDPHLGGHEAFLAEVMGFADDLDIFHADRIQDANAFLAIDTPAVPPAERRFVGDPPRPDFDNIGAATPDEDQPAGRVYGL